MQPTILLFVVAGLTVGAAATISNPRKVAIGATAAAVFLAPMVSVRVTPWLLFADVFLVVVFLLSISVARATSKTLSALLWPLRMPMLAVYLIALGGLIASGGDQDAVVTVVKFTAAIAASMTALSALDPTRRELRLLAGAYVCGAAASGLAGFLVDSLSSRRLYGWSGHSNHLAMAAAFAIAMAVGLAADSQQRRATLMAGLAAFGFFVVIATGSRSGLIMVVVTGVILLIKARRVALALLSGTLIAAIWCGAVLGWIQIGEFSALGRFSGSGNAATSDVQRSEALNESFETIGDNPIFGTGFAAIHDAHSLPIQLWQAAGLFGIAGFTILVVMAIANLRASPNRICLRTATWSSYAGYLVAGLVSNQLWDRYIWLPLVIGLLLAREELPASPSRPAALSSSA